MSACPPPSGGGGPKPRPHQPHRRVGLGMGVHGVPDGILALGARRAGGRVAPWARLLVLQKERGGVAPPGTPANTHTPDGP